VVSNIRKILLSLLSISAVALLAFGASRAFFSDEETSTGNTFVAGAIDLQIDSQCHYFTDEDADGQYLDVGCFTPASPEPIPFGNWQLGNLTTEKFFNFADVKPGDWGENTISLHVYNNDAWACLDISPLADLDNSITEPEDEVDLALPSNDGTPDGDLAENLEFFAWRDDGDNVFEPQGNPLEIPLFSNISGPASDVLSGRTYTLAAPGSPNVFTGVVGDPLVGSNNYYIGLAWCAGDLSVDLGTGVITCNGLTMGNIAQTDSVSADLTFRTEQSRNNPDFDCETEL